MRSPSLSVVVSLVNVAVFLASFGAAFYVVFEKGHSPWWFLAAVAACVVGMQEVKTIGAE